MCVSERLFPLVVFATSIFCKEYVYIIKKTKKFEGVVVLMRIRK